MRKKVLVKKYLYKIAIYPIKLYWFIVRPHGHGVKCIIENGRKEILLVRHTYGKGWWNFPGGNIDKGETSSETALREVREEIGVTLKEVKKIGEFVSTLEYKKDHIEVFEAHTNTNTLITDPAEISEAKWFERSNLPTPLATIAQQALELQKNSSIN